MREILDKYKDRLINLSGKNRSLVSKKIIKKRAFDLFNLKEFNENIFLEVLDFINDEKNERYRILEDYTKEYTYKKEELEKVFEKNIEGIQNEEVFEKLKKEFSKKMEVLEGERNRNTAYLKNLKDLNREIIAIEKETGKRELYLGYPIIEGNFKDGTFFKAPLFLTKVGIVKSGDNIDIVKTLDTKINLNKVFILAIEKYNEIKNIEIEEEFSNISDKDIKKILENLNEVGISLVCKKEEFQKFKEYSKETTPKYALGTGNLVKNIILGQFPLANSIYKDYQNLIEMDIENGLLKALLIENKKDSESESESLEKHGELTFKDEELNLISSLDYSQELAVYRTNKSKKLVIYGPPGTGKSQTITNIISNSLAKGEKILMVSQKRAALDVIYNRLNEIRDRAIIIHDINNDKKSFYSNIINEIDGERIVSEENEDICIYSNEIDEGLVKLEKLGEELTKERRFGISLIEMYEKSKNIEKDIERKEYIKYKRIFEKKEIIETTYKEIRASLDRLDKEKIDAFLVCENIRNKGVLIENLNRDMNEIDIEEILESLENIKGNLATLNEDKYIKVLKNIEKEDEKIANEINKEKNKKYLVKLNIGEWWNLKDNKKEECELVYEHLSGENYKLDEDRINTLGIKYNEKINSDLVKKINDKPWWNVGQLLKYSKNKKREEENLREFKKREEVIISDLRSVAKKMANVYFENNKIDKINEEKFKQEYEKILKEVQKTKYNLKKIKEELKIVKNGIVEEKFLAMTEFIIDKNRFKQEIDKYIIAIKTFKENREYIKIDSKIEKIDKKFLESIKEVEGNLELKKLEKIEKFFIIKNILEIEKNKDTINAIENIEGFKNIKKKITNNMEIKRGKVKDIIENEYGLKIKKLPNEYGFKEFKRQAAKKRALWPIRKYMEEYSHILLDIFPCFLLGPETVSDILPLKEGLFDVVIFDEASQMYIEEAIPTIYRGKKIIIAGDDKQLRPNGTFKSTIETDTEEGERHLAALEEESLLDLAKVNYDSVKLMYHYRSKYEELINFSNYAFYDGKLKIAPNLVKNEKFKPIERIKCEGRWIDKQNIEEANEVCNLLYKIFKERKNDETIGIITFNITQKSAIENALELKALTDTLFRDFYVKEIEKTKNGEDISLFVKNIENVQGDERDIIIFSIGYAKNEKDKIYGNFGSLSTEGGENRLNVAISRAKEKIYVVTSIEPEELNVDSAMNKGPKIFKKYLQYARAVSNENVDEQKNILNSLLDTSVQVDLVIKHDSIFEQEVYEALKEKGYEVHTQIGVSGYKIDLAIYDNKKSMYILGIECDGATYHSSKSARERDIERQLYLESRGWRIHRIWSKLWWTNPKREIEKIIEIVSNNYL